MKAIVVGATGFIGSHVVRALLTEEIDVRILRRASSPTLALEGLKVEEAIGDLEDPRSLREAFRGCHVLFHAAGYYPIYSFRLRQQKESALRQMRHLLDAAADAGIGKIVYTSSMSTIGRPNQGKWADEETPYHPRHFRGAYYEIKYLLEQEALQAAGRGVPVTVVNPTGVFGDGDVKPTSGALIVKIARREVPAIIDAPMNAVDVRDVARGQIAAMKLGKVGRRYLLGGHNTTVGSLARLIARLAKVPPPKLRLPLFLAAGAATLSEIAGSLLHQPKPILPRVGIEFLRYGGHYNCERARRELGFQSTPLEETIRRAIEWFRVHRYI